jgi:hypothetical protein
MEEAPENGKELSHSACANGIEENRTKQNILTIFSEVLNYLWTSLGTVAYFSLILVR